MTEHLEAGIDHADLALAPKLLLERVAELGLGEHRVHLRSHDEARHVDLLGQGIDVLGGEGPAIAIEERGKGRGHRPWFYQRGAANARSSPRSEAVPSFGHAMRAHDPTARNKGAGLARARMLMKAKLGWLSGYPDADGWTVVPEDGERAAEPLTLGRDHLRRATYTASKLRGEFPRAMPTLVGDVDAWHHAVSHVLASLKPWVHHGHAPPAELFESELYSRTTRTRAKALRQQHPSLRGLVDALSWVLATHATSAAKALAWVERKAAALTIVHEQLDEPTALALSIELVHLSVAVGPKALRPLMQLVGQPAGYRAPTHGVVEHLRQADALFGSSDRPTLPPEPPVRLPGELSTLTRWLLAQDRATAKRCLRGGHGGAAPNQAGHPHVPPGHGSLRRQGPRAAGTAATAGARRRGLARALTGAAWRGTAPAPWSRPGSPHHRRQCRRALLFHPVQRRSS